MTTATAKPAPPREGSEAVTRRVRVRVTPSFIPEQSDVHARKWVFGYRIAVTNEGDRSVQLLDRQWNIVDANGARHEVRGEGVVGRQPVIEPGQTFEYSSFCPLSTRWGTMDGRYTMRDDEGGRFDAAVARFFLIGPETAR